MPLKPYISMADLVFQNSNGNDVTTSLIVAQVFGKEHKNVVRDIENLSCSENFNRLNFERITYKDARNREQTAYEMTKDGFSFLVMGYTGTKAGEFKERFINEFNRRESLLKDDDYILMRSQQILQKRLEASEEKIKQLESQAEQQQETIELQQKELTQSAPKKYLFSFGDLQNCCTFAMLQVDRIIYLAEQAVKLLIFYMGIFYAHTLGYWRLPIRKLLCALRGGLSTCSSVYGNRFLFAYYLHK
jgi:Rha family phage regulatory protein